MAGPFLFCSGQIPLDPASGQVVEDDIAAQTRRVLENLGALLQAAGVSFDAVVKTTVFLADMVEFAAMNEVYAGVVPGLGKFSTSPGSTSAGARRVRRRAPRSRRAAT